MKAPNTPSSSTLRSHGNHGDNKPPFQLTANLHVLPFFSAHSVTNLSVGEGVFIPCAYVCVSCACLCFT